MKMTVTSLYNKTQIIKRLFKKSEEREIAQIKRQHALVQGLLSDVATQLLQISEKNGKV